MEENKILSDQEILEKIKANYVSGQQTVHNVTTKNEILNYPSELVDLPSGGIFYPKDHPLASGQIRIKYMTTKEEDILTSQNLIKKGVVIDELLKSLILTPVNYGDILIGDKNGIIVAARILAYGYDYKFEINCPNCTHKNTITYDLRKIQFKEIKKELITPHENSFHLVLPVTQKKVRVKLLTNADEAMIEKTLNDIKKVKIIKDIPERQISVRLKYIIQEVEGITDRATIDKFVDNLPAQDSKFIRNFIKECNPDVDMSFDFICENCSHEEKLSIPLTVEFFWPST